MVAVHSPATPVDLDAVADSVNVVFEGAYVVARATRDGTVVVDQLRLLRTMLSQLFEPDARSELAVKRRRVK